MGRSRVFKLLGLFVAIQLLLVFAGCGSVSGSGAITPSPSPTPTATPSPSPTPSPTPTQASHFIYGTPGFESGSVQGGTIQSDGSVSAIPGSPFSENMGQPSIIQILPDPKGRFIYVLNVEASAFGMVIGSPGIAGFKINRQTGALTAVPGSPIIFPVRNNNLMAIDGTGHFLFEPNGQDVASTGYDVYSIDQNTGALTKTISNSNAPPVGSFAAASADGQFLFNAGSGLVQVFSIAAATGQLTAAPGTPLSSAGSAGPLAASSDGKFLYVANQDQGTVAVFSIGSGGSLGLVAGSPFPIDQGAQGISLTPDGRFLYVAAFTVVGNSTSETVKGYSVNPVTGTFTPIATAVVSNVDTVTVDLSGKFAFISAPGSLFTYAIDPATGALTQLSHTSGPSSDDPNDVVTVP